MTELELYALLCSVYKESGWPIWTKPYDLNVFGVRNAVRTVDAWDDVFGVFYTNDEGVHRVERFVASTDPGGFYLRNPMTPLGTIVVEPGYHKGLWKLGTHTGYPALQQVGTLTYRRELDGVSSGILTGTGNGVNAHHGYDSATVGRNSAGCQVLRMKDALTRVLWLVRQQAAHGLGDTVSYGLIDEERTPRAAPLIRISA